MDKQIDMGGEIDLDGQIKRHKKKDRQMDINIDIKMDRQIRVLPHRPVDNNLGPDRLASPKALDPNYCRQPTL